MEINIGVLFDFSIQIESLEVNPINEGEIIFRLVPCLEYVLRLIPFVLEA